MILNICLSIIRFISFNLFQSISYFIIILNNKLHYAIEKITKSEISETNAQVLFRFLIFEGFFAI